MTATVTQLKIDDEDFLVASLIDRCPKTMMLRELVQNAIEASCLAPEGKRKVDIGVVQVDGGKKLRILNTGPGMDEASLYSMCDIASSIGKLKGLDKNFGMGAKVASLPSNHLGVRYRSCCRGRVHEVIIGKRNGVYGRILRPHRRSPEASGQGFDRLVDVLDVTSVSREEGYDLAFDWTEVVLLGMRPEQNTFSDPYDGDPAMPEYWLADALYSRYFRIPDGVEIRISPDYLWRPETSVFRTLSQRAKGSFAGYECVSSLNGLKIHYFYDPTCKDRPWENASSEGALQTAIGQVSLIYRDEIYERKFGSSWAYDAPMYGIAFSARNFSIHVELPDDYPVRPDAYRQFLMKTDGEQIALTPAEFAETVYASRPAWLLDIIGSLGGDQAGLSTVVGGLAGLSQSLNLAALEDSSTPSPVLDGATSDAKQALGFDIILLHNEEDINDRWLRGRAACFYRSTMQLFINTHYVAVERMKQSILASVGDSTPSPKLVELAEQLAIDSVVTRVGRALLFGISKHLDADNWQFGHIEKAMSPEALSIAADDADSMLPWALREVASRLGAKM